MQPVSRLTATSAAMRAEVRARVELRVRDWVLGAAMMSLAKLDLESETATSC